MPQSLLSTPIRKPVDESYSVIALQRYYLLLHVLLLLLLQYSFIFIFSYSSLFIVHCSLFIAPPWLITRSSSVCWSL